MILNMSKLPKATLNDETGPKDIENVIVHKQYTRPRQDDLYVMSQSDGDVQDRYRMSLYERIEGIPTGLEPLVNLTDISLTIGLPIPVSFDVVVNRNYNITNQFNQKIYHCGENTNHCVDYCCNGHRSFELHFFDGRGRTVMTAKQDCSFCLCFSRAECTGANLTMRLANKELIGTIRQKYSCCRPRYEVMDPNGILVMNLIGPYGGVWTQICGRKFKVSLCSSITYASQRQVVATINKRTIQMPEDLSIMHKALLLGCLFIVELDYYQSSRTYLKVATVVILLFVTLICVGLIYPEYI